MVLVGAGVGLGAGAGGVVGGAIVGVGAGADVAAGAAGATAARCRCRGRDAARVPAVADGDGLAPAGPREAAGDWTAGGAVVCPAACSAVRPNRMARPNAATVLSSVARQVSTDRRFRPESRRAA